MKSERLGAVGTLDDGRTVVGFERKLGHPGLLEQSLESAGPDLATLEPDYSRIDVPGRARGPGRGESTRRRRE